MAQHLVDCDKVKVNKCHFVPASVSVRQGLTGFIPLLQLPRPQRFLSSYLNRVETLVETVSEHIFWKNKDLAEETRSANLAVAAFVKVRTRK